MTVAVQYPALVYVRTWTRAKCTCNYVEFHYREGALETGPTDDEEFGAVEGHWYTSLDIGTSTKILL